MFDFSFLVCFEIFLKVTSIQLHSLNVNKNFATFTWYRILFADGRHQVCWCWESAYHDTQVEVRMPLIIQLQLPSFTPTP